MTNETITQEGKNPEGNLLQLKRKKKVMPYQEIPTEDHQ